MNTFEQRMDSGSASGSATVVVSRSSGVDDRSERGFELPPADEVQWATPAEIVRWCAGWFILGLGGWGAAIALGWLAMGAVGPLIP